MNKYNRHKYMGRTTYQKSWTHLAIDCYRRGCICDNCLIAMTIESGKCQMKAAVLELVRVYGVPDYTEITLEDGTIDYIIHGKRQATHYNKPDAFEKYKEYITEPTKYIVETHMQGVNKTNKAIAALFIEGKSRDEVGKIIGMDRRSIGSLLSKIYTATQEKVRYKTKHKKLEEFVKFFKNRMEE